jgi:hypothetical protein
LLAATLGFRVDFAFLALTMLVTAAAILWIQYSGRVPLAETPSPSPEA